MRVSGIWVCLLRPATTECPTQLDRDATSSLAAWGQAWCHRHPPAGYRAGRTKSLRRGWAALASKAGSMRTIHAYILESPKWDLNVHKAAWSEQMGERPRKRGTGRKARQTLSIIPRNLPSALLSLPGWWLPAVSGFPCPCARWAGPAEAQRPPDTSCLEALHSTWQEVRPGAQHCRASVHGRPNQGSREALQRPSVSKTLGYPQGPRVSAPGARGSSTCGPTQSAAKP